ncbi:TMEM175 family protein, partial [Acinetobacter baumannii]
MVLDLKVPEHAAGKGLLNGLLLPMAPKLLSYSLSFLVVIIMWMNHHALFATVRNATRSIFWLNNLLLFSMSLIPFATGFLGENPRL